MSSPRQRSRVRRRVERTMAEAFEAAAAGQLALADKLSRRAVEQGFVNPRIWHDRGLVARLCGDEDAAEQAFRRAIAIAPTYGEAFAALGRLQAARGRLPAAERLLRRAAGLCPGDAVLRAEHAALAPHRAAEDEAGDLPAAGEDPPAPPTARAARFDWAAVRAELEARGVVRLPRLLEPAEAAAAAAWPDGFFDARLEREDEGARAAWAFLREPLPDLAAELCAALRAGLAPLARSWAERFPRFARPSRSGSGAAGGGRPDLARLRLEDGGFVAPIPPPAESRRGFPFRALVCLGEDAGVEHLLRDLRPGRGRHERRSALRPGDGLLACDSARLVAIAGVVGFQEVGHGIAEVAGPPATVLLLSFDSGR